VAVVETGRFTVGVFQDVAWAERGLEALKRHGFPPESITIMAKPSPETASLVERALGAPGGSVELHGAGAITAAGPMLDPLQGSDRGLTTIGLGPAFKRVGFQAHDGQIFEALLARGGVLVGIHTEPRAADALAVLHAYGGGNAAIGAWTGRV
jgi:hypothetical protein